MPTNPYKPIDHSRAGQPHPVKRYAASSVIAFVVALFVALPAIVLLYGDMSRRMASGRRYVKYDREIFIFGHSVSPDTVTAWSLGMAAAFVALSALTLFVAFRNRRLNRNAAE